MVPAKKIDFRSRWRYLYEADRVCFGDHDRNQVSEVKFNERNIFKKTRPIQETGRQTETVHDVLGMGVHVGSFEEWKVIIPE